MSLINLKMTKEDIRKELEWLRRRLHGHSQDGETVGLGYASARIDDIITSFLELPLQHDSGTDASKTILNR